MSRGWTKVDYRLVAIASFAMAVFMFITGLFDGKPAYADSSLTVEILSGETPTSSVSASVAPTINASGTYVKSDNVTVKVKTDNDTGYELSLRANDASHPDRLINATDDSYFESIASATTESAFKNTDLSTITTSGGKQGIWGYLPSKYNSADNSSFLPTPGTAGHSLDKTATSNPTTANNYTLTIGAKISQHATVGAYTNSFAIVAVANPNPYTINYVENTGLVTNMPENVIGATTSNSTVTLSSTTPTRAGYIFKEWNTAEDGTGTAYQPGATYTLASGANLKLYAIWTESMTFHKAFAVAGKSQSGGYYVMQDATSGICCAVDTGEIGEVKDSRDGTVYHIGKLADGKCWLLDNLALDLTDDTILNNLSSSNTNASKGLPYLKGTSTGSTSDKYATAKVANWTSSYSYSAPLVNMTNKDVVPTSYNGTDDPMKDKVVAGNWKVGGYYNYCAASAGSYCYGNGTSYGTSSGNATEDICPKGWRMPTGNSGEYQTLYSNTNYNTYDKYREALRLPLSGYFFNGSAGGQGSVGRWWSSTRYSNGGMYSLNADTSDIRPANDDYRLSGYSVRCVLGS